MSAAHVRRGGAARAKRQEAVEGRSPEEDRQAAAGRSGPGEQGRRRSCSAPSCSPSASSCWSRSTSPPRPSAPPATAVGRAGFTVSGYQIVGINHMNRALVDAVVTDELHRAAAEAGFGQGAAGARRRRRDPPPAARAMAGSRTRASRAGCPDTLVIDIVERKPAALWQNQGQLALIDSEGVVLDRVPVDRDARPAAPDRPRCERRGGAARPPHGRRSDPQAAARLGNLGRRPPLGPQLPVRRDRRSSRRRGNRQRQRSIKFAHADKQSGLLGRGIVRFDLRVPGQDDRPSAARSRRADRAAAGGSAASGLNGQWRNRSTNRSLPSSTSAHRRSAR